MQRGLRFRMIASLVGFAVPGLLSLVPSLTALAQNLPPDAPPLPVMIALTLLQPLVLVTLAALLGTHLAPRAGFDAPALTAWLTGGQPGPVLKQQLRAGLPAGIAAGAVLVLLDLFLFEGRTAQLGMLTKPPVIMDLIVGLLYGGIVEEILMRWGLMSLLVWLATYLFRGQDGKAHPAAVWTGITLAALLFAVGHLPAVQGMVGAVSTALLARTLLLNALGGILFGWLYVRRGLESAVFAHMGAHIGMFILRLLLV